MRSSKRHQGATSAYAKYAMLADLFRYDVLGDYDSDSAPYECTLCALKFSGVNRDKHGREHVAKGEAVETVDRHNNLRYARVR